MYLSYSQICLPSSPQRKSCLIESVRFPSQVFMVVLGCVQTLRLMKDSFTSKSRCWAGRCPLEYLVTLCSLKRANSHSIHTAAFSQVTTKQAFGVRHLNAEQWQRQGGRRDVLWGCAYIAAVLGARRESWASGQAKYSAG